jgi:hypothetical protein
MHRKIGAAVVAIALFTGTTTVSFAENTGGTSSPSSGQDSSGKDIGNTSSTHNPRPSSPGATGMENRKQGETGTDTSTHNPPRERR